MDRERRHILRMLAEGRISAGECDALLNALGHSSPAFAPSSCAPSPPSRSSLRARRSSGNWAVLILLLVLCSPLLLLLPFLALFLLPVFLLAAFLLSLRLLRWSLALFLTFILLPVLAFALLSMFLAALPLILLP